MTEGLDFREKGIYRLANAGLLAGVALFGGERFLGIGSLTVWLVAEAVVILGLLAGINFLPLRGKLICLSAAVPGVAAAVSAAGMQESLLFLRAYFPWLMGTGEGYGQWTEGYAFLQTAIIVVLCYIAQMIFERISCMKILFATLLLAGGMFCMFGQRAVPHWGMAFGLCYVVTVYAEWAEGRWKKVRSGSRKAYMLRIMPFLAVYLLLVGCMPAPEAPFEWRWVKNIYHQVSETFQAYTQMIKWGGREGFDMAFSGYSEEAALGGDLQDNPREKADAVMTIQMLDNAHVNVYLTGMVYDHFDGREWLQNDRGESRGVFADAAETLRAAEAFGGQYRSDYLHNIKLRICYQDFNTGYVFAPLKTWQINSEEKEFAYTGEGGGLRLDHYRGYGTAYDLQYYQMNGGQEEFYRFLEECSDRDSAFPQDVYENYLGEIRLSEEVAEYLTRITQGAETDVERLRAVERELSSFVYTWTPGELPGWVTDEGDFLDYFLLDSRQGYCTYFATAFVLLARAEGIPARYVQGFCVPAQDTKEVYVYSDMAHAWPEVYLSGVGWIPFEPTPGYSQIRFTPWELKRPKAAEAAGEDAVEDMGELHGGDESVWPKEVPEAAQEEGQEPTGHLRKVLGYTVPAILAGYMLLLLLDNVWSGYRYRRMCPQERFKLEVSRNLRILAMLGLKRREWETLQELGDRCRARGDFEAGEDTAGRIIFIENYESVVYGGRSVSDEMIREAAEERMVFLEILRREKRWAYVRWRVRMCLMRYR